MVTRNQWRNIAIAATAFWNLGTPTGLGFTDIVGHWNETCIRRLADRNLVSGYPDGSFKPEASVTRAEFAILALNTTRVFFHHSRGTRWGGDFPDVPASHWARDAIQRAYQYYLFEGYPDGRFQPDLPIPRVQSLVVFANAINFRVPDNPTQFLSQQFDDADDIPQWAQRSIAAATLGRIAVNYPNPRQLNPSSNATRAEIAAMMCQGRSFARTVPIEYISGENLGLAIVPEMGGIDSFADGLALAKVGEKYGYLDTNGNEVIEPQFEDAKSFSQGLAAARDGGKWGYIDTRGNWAIAPQFDGAGPFSQDLAIVTLPSGQGVIDRAGTLQTQIARSDVQPFLPESATVRDILISPFADGLARVTVELEGGFSDRVGFIDGTGNWAIALQEHPILDFSEGLAAIEIDGKYGYIDQTGQIAIAAQFKGAQPFSEGLAAVEFANRSPFYTWGYIDRSAEVVIAPQFYSAQSFSEGLAGVGSQELGSGYIDRSGTLVISRDTIRDLRGGSTFSEGFARVKIGDWAGYIDRDGNIVVEPQFASAWDVSGGMARVDLSGQWVDRLGGYDGSAVPIYETRLEGSQWGYIQLPVR